MKWDNILYFYSNIVIELAVHWAVERLYGVEGYGPFNEF